MTIQQPKSDISTRQDVERLVDRFYEQVMEDEEIGFIFTDVAKINLEHHLPILHDFWESTLFHTARYSGNPIQVHLALNQKVKLTKAHFDRWLHLWNATIDSLFSGPTADQAKTRALSIATIMQLKLRAGE